MRQRVTAGICGRAKLPYTMGQGTKKRKKKGLGGGRSTVCFKDMPSIRSSQWVSFFLFKAGNWTLNTWAYEEHSR